MKKQHQDLYNIAYQFKCFAYYHKSAFIQLHETLDTDGDVTCDELLYRYSALDSAESLFRNHSKTSSPSAWRQHWQESHLCRDVAENLALPLDYSVMSPCASV